MNVKRDILYILYHEQIKLLNEMFNDLINGNLISYLAFIVRNNFRHIWE